jgi:hypothetical protein
MLSFLEAPKGSSKELIFTEKEWSGKNWMTGKGITW